MIHLQHIQKLQEQVLWIQVWQWDSFAYLYCIQKYMKMQKFGKRKKLYILPLVFNLSYHEIHNYIPFSFYARIVYSSWNYSYENRIFWKPYGSNSNIRKREPYYRDFRRFSVSCMYQFSWYSMIDPRVICSEWESYSPIPPISAHNYS